jgi:hypothetical protein
MKTIPESIRQTVIAGAPLLIVIILFAVVGNFGVSKVLKVRSEIESAQNTEQTLTQKLNLLKTLSSDAALKSGIVTSAVPDSNPSLTVSSQLKTMAGVNGVILSAIKSSVGSVNSSGLNDVNITFSVEGARQQVFSFLESVAKISPITITNKISISEVMGLVKADINVKSYWADFPKTIPSVTTPITDLTTAEKEILANISGLTQPIFTEVTPSQGEINPNPFGQ